MEHQTDDKMGGVLIPGQHTPFGRRWYMRHNHVSSAEIAAFVEGTADRDTARRVLASAISDPDVRQQVELLRTIDEDFENEIAIPGEAPADFAARAEELRAKMQNAVQQIWDETEQGRQQQRTFDAIMAEGNGGVIANATDALLAFWNRTQEAIQQSLTLGRHALTLPCLAPANAASPPALSVARQSVTAEGVRIEFQQLPGTPARLRVVVDASALHSEKDFHKQTNTATTKTKATETTNYSSKGETNANQIGYNVAYLTLEDGDSARPDRHILVVSLNTEGRGFTDYVVGGSGTRALPATQTLCSLVSATLSHLDRKNRGIAAHDFDEFEVGTPRGGTA
jgi:hypothetical protein